GMVRSLLTSVRPSQSCCVRVALATAVANDGASTPAVHKTVLASYRVMLPSWSSRRRRVPDLRLLSVQEVERDCGEQRRLVDVVVRQARQDRERVPALRSALA